MYTQFLLRTHKVNAFVTNKFGYNTKYNYSQFERLLKFLICNISKIESSAYIKTLLIKFNLGWVYLDWTVLTWACLSEVKPS